MILPSGYSDVTAGQLATVVTCLEMRAMPVLRAEPEDPRRRLRPVLHPAVDWYRDLFRRVGAEWLWYSRLAMPTPDLESILNNPGVAVHALSIDGSDEGLLELDFRQAGSCELAFFGLTGAALGGGAGRWLMNRALELAWRQPIARLWVHTCTLDHPAALTFYLRSGFRAYARQVEVAEDPRLTGLLPRTAAAHVPIIGSLR